MDYFTTGAEIGLLLHHVETHFHGASPIMPKAKPYTAQICTAQPLPTSTPKYSKLLLLTIWGSILFWAMSITIFHFTGAEP